MEYKKVMVHGLSFTEILKTHTQIHTHGCVLTRISNKVNSN